MTSEESPCPKSRKYFFPLLMMAVLALVVSSACKKEQKTTVTPPAIEVTPVVQRNVNVRQEWVGTTDGSDNAQIRAQVEGYIIKQDYTEGQLVKKGQLLFEIDPRTFIAAVKQAKADVAQRQARWDTAKLNLARVEPLAKQNAVSKKDLDDAVGAELSSRAEVEAAKAALAKAQLDLGFTKITSPIEGIAGIAKVGTGSLVGPGRTEELTTVSKLDPIKVYIYLSEQDYLKVAGRTREPKQDRGIELILANGKVYPERGEMSVAEREIDPKTGTIKVVLLFPNPGNILRPGQYARISAITQTKNNALLVPQRAVTELQGQYQVAVVHPDNTVHVRTVKASDRIDGCWVIDEGLKPGDRVVAEGTQKVKDNMLVRAVPFGGAAAGGTQAPSKPEQTQPPAEQR